ncbi:MAG: glycosyltransferase family 9 protein [Myxococcota bacterium]|jgi:ADP-heptose:LPS heptosyltransferase|nr:glycosyltransferase family 9 protein [Myxococcota bacterium]
MSRQTSGDIVVVSINGLGDQILTWPTMRALHQLYPNRLKLVLGVGMRFMFCRDVPFKGQVRALYQDREALTFDVDKVAAAIGPCDTLIHLGPWLSDSLWDVICATKPRRSIGLNPAFSDDVKVAADVHMFERSFALAEHLDPDLIFEDFCAPPVFSPPAENLAQRLAQETINKHEKFLFVHPETLVNKMWRATYFDEVLAAFLERCPEYRVVVCSRHAYALRAHPRVHHLHPHLEVAMALVGLADCFLGVDSCFLHAADLYRIPGVALFGTTQSADWGFRLAQPSVNIDGDGDMSRIKPEEVLSALLKVAPRA